MSPLISVEELHDRLDDVLMFDIRWALTDPNHGRTTYEAGHIPGAVFVDLDVDLADPPGVDGRHPLPSAERWASTLGRLGVKPSSEVVVYDDIQGSTAARMWWMLAAIGHESVRLLDGGYQAWVREGFETETEPVEPETATYPVPPGFRGVAGLEDLAGRDLVDVRAAERYRGETEPVDPKAGHIPGAINLPMDGSLDEDGRFLRPEALRERFASIGEHPIVHCGSGVNACHTALAMVVSGRQIPDLYAGSFSEWSRRDRPVKTGSSP